MATFMPGVRIGQVHGTSQPVDPETGARNALAFAMYHPAAALRTAAIERESYEDIARVPEVLLGARRRREAEPTAPEPTAPEPSTAAHPDAPAPSEIAPSPATVTVAAEDGASDDESQLTLF
jgi:hypothetical protein